FIFVIDVAEGDKIPRKGGPGICNSDLLVINKIDLAPHVGADLDVMRRDSLKMRGERPFLLVSLRQKEGVEEVIRWVREQIQSRRDTSGHRPNFGASSRPTPQPPGSAAHASSWSALATSPAWDSATSRSRSA